METLLDNLYLDITDLSQSATHDILRTVQLTQSRLAIFFTDINTGQPLIGLPVFVDIQCNIRYKYSDPSSGNVIAQELADAYFTTRIPLGLLATDHVGYISYDISRLPDLVNITDTYLLTLTSEMQQQLKQSLDAPISQISIKSIWIHPYGDYAFDGLKPGLFGIRPDAIVINAVLNENILPGSQH